MARTSKKSDVISLTDVNAPRPELARFSVWLVGESPLITHAWSEKARREMLEKQLKTVKASGKLAREPEKDYRSSLYEMDAKKKTYGFPVTGIKSCFLSAAHKDKGIARVAVQRSLYLDADMTRVRPALAGAICDMPLVQIHGSEPEMREDMVRIGSGMNKVANLAYRGQFTTWAIFISGRIDEKVIPINTFIYLINESGTSCGLGEWRNEKAGVFGAFHMANAQEQEAWTKFAKGRGKLPVPERYNPIDVGLGEVA